jgi:outer membrane protein assembly factor BamD
MAKAESYYGREKYFQSAELYKAFLARYPGDDRSDYAQFRLAESYFNDDEYPLAAVEYQVLISNYGYSDYVDDALFKMGVSFWEDAPSVQRDQQKVRDALSRFEQFLQTFPSSELAPEVRRYIGLVHERLAHKAYLNARWYYRTNKYGAALIYFDKVIDNYPGNQYWARSVYHKGLIFMKRGERDDAARYFSQVLDYPGDVSVKSDARDRLAELREQ